MTPESMTVRVGVCLGPDEIDVNIECAIHAGERRVMFDGNGEGSPGSPPWVEILDAVVIETDGSERRMNDVEETWLLAAEEEVEQKAFEEAERIESGHKAGGGCFRGSWDGPFEKGADAVWYLPPVQDRQDSQAGRRHPRLEVFLLWMGEACLNVLKRWLSHA